MGSKDKDKRKLGAGEKNQNNLRVRPLDKPIAPTCQCPQISTSSFPYKEFPPPAPPDGRSDLWDLQFCRWWGWNWVRKRESVIESSLYKSEEQRKPTLSSKCRTIEEKQCPAKDGYLTDQMPAPPPPPPPRTLLAPPQPKLKKSSRPRKGHDPKPLRQKQFTPKEQFKVMCNCLLGKKNTPCGMAKLYNTPSASVITIRRDTRISYGIGDKSVQEIPEKSIRISKWDDCDERGCKAKPWSENKPPSESATPCSRQSLTENTEDAPCESLYSHRNESSTEDSIEYLTVRLQHVTSDSACPCQKHPCPASKTKEEVVDERNQTEPITIICRKESKETQTCPAAEKKKVPSPIDDCLCSEKLIKLKGKKHKTICIMVCCCSACKQNNASPNPPKNYSDESYLSRCVGCEKQEAGCSCKKCPKVCWNEAKNSVVMPDKEFSSTRNFDAVDELTTVPVAVSPVNVKKFSKFGTPSKKYPWMQSTESAGTTISLNNAGNRTNTSAISDIYEWLKPDLDERKLPDLIGITEDLSYLKRLDRSKKSSAEDRILLDAVCDAILREHDDKTSQFLDEFHVDRNYQCNLNSDHNTVKTDVYTELSKALVNQEDVGVQLSATRNLDELLKQSDVNRLDNMMNNIMNNIFSESNDNNVLKNESKSTTAQQNRFTFPKPDRAFTRTGLMPFQASTTFRKTTKRGAPPPESGRNECKKKLRQEEPNKTSDRIGNIFSKIDDIVQKSKVKTAEIQKVLSFVPKKPDALCIDNNLNGLKLETNQHTNDDTPNINIAKRNYPMSSDTFKGIICEEVAKQFDYLNVNKSYNDVNDKVPVVSGNAFAEPDCNEEYEVSNIIGADNKEYAIKDNLEAVNKKISKLSMHNFVVCDEKSKSETESASTSSAAQGQQSLLRKRDYYKTSLIPIRKRSSTE